MNKLSGPDNDECIDSIDENVIYETDMGYADDACTIQMPHRFTCYVRVARRLVVAVLNNDVGIRSLGILDEGTDQQASELAVINYAGYLLEERSARIDALRTLMIEHAQTH